MATLVTQNAVVLLQIVIAKRVFKMEYSIPYFTRLLLVLAVAIPTAYFTREVFDHFLIHTFVVLMLFGALTILVGLINKKEILSFVKNKN
jgi:hypothetical protein